MLRGGVRRRSDGAAIRLRPRSSEASADALRALISPDGLKWQFTMAFRTRRWSIPTAGSRALAVASTPERVAGQLEHSPTTAAYVDLYPRVHGTSVRRRCRCWRVGPNDQIFGPDGALAFARDLPRPRSTCSTAATSVGEPAGEVVALIGPFLEGSFGSGRESALAI